MRGKNGLSEPSDPARRARISPTLRQELFLLSSGGFICKNLERIYRHRFDRHWFSTGTVVALLSNKAWRNLIHKGRPRTLPFTPNPSTARHTRHTHRVGDRSRFPTSPRWLRGVAASTLSEHHPASLALLAVQRHAQHRVHVESGDLRSGAGAIVSLTGDRSQRASGLAQCLHLAYRPGSLRDEFERHRAAQLRSWRRKPPPVARSTRPASSFDLSGRLRVRRDHLRHLGCRPRGGAAASSRCDHWRPRRVVVVWWCVPALSTDIFPIQKMACALFLFANLRVTKLKIF
jgi:hypothetical protein